MSTVAKYFGALGACFPNGTSNFAATNSAMSSLKNPVGALSQMYSDAQVTVGFPVLLPQIDSPAYSTSAFVSRWIR